MIDVGAPYYYFISSAFRTTLEAGNLPSPSPATNDSTEPGTTTRKLRASRINTRNPVSLRAEAVRHPLTQPTRQSATHRYKIAIHLPDYIDQAMHRTLLSTQSSSVSVSCTHHLSFLKENRYRFASRAGSKSIMITQAYIHGTRGRLSKRSTKFLSPVFFLLTARIVRGNKYPNVVITNLS